MLWNDYGKLSLLQILWKNKYEMQNQQFLISVIKNKVTKSIQKTWIRQEKELKTCLG